MAKRKRLNAAPGSATEPDMAQSAGFGPPGPLETKAFLRPGLGTGLGTGMGTAPIARVAGEASAQAALAGLAEEMRRARHEGRLVLALPLAAIEADHLVRDRIETDEEAMGQLIASIREHGQRSPIEVTDLGNGRYGLISGWRRFQALTRLSETERGAETDGRAETENGPETGSGPQFGTVLALLRHPGAASDAYIAMVEENEVRLGLSYYERARIAARAVDLGVFPSEKQALQRLFSTASRARRSKIGSFLTLYRGLDAVLRFPAAIPERLGLALARLLETDPARIAALHAALTAAPAPDAATEQALLARCVAGKSGSDMAQNGGAQKPEAVALAASVTEPRPGVFLEVTGGFVHPVLTLSGPAVDPGFRERLEHWLVHGV